MLLHKLHLRIAHTTSRLISTTRVCEKQPAHDRQRYKRHHQEPRHSVPFVDEAPLDSLPKKPLPILGSWGSIDPDLKLLYHKHEKRVRQMPTTFDKLEELYHLERNLWYHSFDLPLQSPGMLPFVQQVTRTNVHHVETPSVTYPKSIEPYLTHCLQETSTHLHRAPINAIDQSPEAVQARSKQRCLRIAAFMEVFYQTWMQQHSGSSLAAGQLHQLDERATVETFVKRYTSPTLFETTDSVAEDLFDPVDDTVWDSNDETVRYRIRAELAWQLRGTQPLQSFVAIDDPVCLENRIPECFHRPEAFDMKPVDCYRFSSLPHTQVLDYSECARSIAGYWSDSPFSKGDSCEFGILGALDGMRGEQVRQSIQRSGLPEESKQLVLEQHHLSEMLLTAFAWTSAQAYNQGFTLYNELTYPLATQLLLIDDDHVQLLRYQLNSLSALWKQDDSGLPYNVAWCSPKIRLFNQDVSSNQCVSISVNPTAVSLIASALSHPIDTSRSSASLRPYLAITSDEEVQQKPQVIRLIPSSEELSSLASNVNTEATSSPLSPEEEAILEAERREQKINPVRLYTPARPHPNEVYFFKPTEKSALIDEFRDEIPSFGGVYSQLPEPFETRLQESKLRRRNRAPRSKVQAPPQRWR